MTWADRLRRLVKIANRLETLEVRYLGVSGVSLLRRRAVLVLETTGRRTGRRRRVVLSYLERDGAFVVGGGAGGMTKVDWVANLRTNPDATVWVRRTPIDVHARELRDDERVAAHDRAMARWPEVSRYEEVSGRLVPYFAFTRR